MRNATRASSDCSRSAPVGSRAVRAVAGLSFAVARGESFGLVGESGSGKSTVLRAIAGLIPDARGRIVVDGETLDGTRSRAFRRRVQMVFQDPFGSLHPRHTVDQILSEPARIHRLDAIEARVLRALDVSVQAEVLNLLTRLKREHGLTYLLVSHDFAVVSHMCDRLSVMQHGAVLETLGIAQLRANRSEHPYTRQLLQASQGYDRAAVDALEDDF